MSYQVECKTKEEYRHILYIIKNTEFASEIYRFMLKEYEQGTYYFWPCIVTKLDEPAYFSGNFSNTHNSFEIVTLKEFEKRIGCKTKGEKGMESLEDLGLAKAVEQKLAILGVKCLESNLVKSIIQKEGFKFGIMSISNEKLEQIKKLISIGECEPQKATVSNDFDDYEEDDEGFDQSLYDSCNNLSDKIDDLVYELEADDIDFDETINEAVLLRSRLESFPSKSMLPINSLEVDAIILALKAHSQRQASLDKEYKQFSDKIIQKLDSTTKILDDMADAC